MLDYFLSKGYVDFDGDGNVVRLNNCPTKLKFEENRDGRVVFFVTLPNGVRKGISDPEDWEFLDVVES